MIISHKHKFIFLRVIKTASTSMAIALSKYCGSNDVISRLPPKDEALRKKMGYRGAQNNKFAPIWDYTLKSIAWHALNRCVKHKLNTHALAREVKKEVGTDVWNNYYKFCFVRNPWDMIISDYYWVYQKEPRPPISDYLESMHVLRLRRKAYDVYTINGEVAVDRLCRFENITAEAAIIEKEIGLPGPLILPRAKTQYRQDKRSYREILNKEDQNKIANIFKEEIQLLGYKF